MVEQAESEALEVRAETLLVSAPTAMAATVATEATLVEQETPAMVGTEATHSLTAPTVATEASLVLLALVV
jgi:hypothetical protein